MKLITVVAVAIIAATTIGVELTLATQPTYQPPHTINRQERIR